MKKILSAVVVLASALMVTMVAPVQQSNAAVGNPVVKWNEIALNTITSDATRGTPSAASLYVAMVQAAVYDAVMAIEPTHEPYIFDGDARGASMDAAVATAARDVLVKYFGSTSSLESAYSQSMSEIKDGASKNAGVRVGQQAAAAIIAARANDGRNAAVAAPPDGDEPGEWVRTGSGNVVTPYVAQVRPFLAESPEQFRAKGPLPIDSHRYAVEFERTRLYGAFHSPVRSEEQTEIARFWTENTVRQYNRALRGLALARSLSTVDTARLFAMTDIPAADAMITCWNTKFHHLAWRPVTAIHNADTDGNDRTTADPTWQPLSTTALHPEYVSGHACLTGAITRGLEEFFGTKKIDLQIDSTVTGSTHHFPTVDDLRKEVEDARVFGGDHWDTGGSDGTLLGHNLAKWALKRYFERI